MAPAMRAPPPCRNSPCATGRQAGWLARPHWPVRWRLSTIWGQVQCATPWGSAPVSPRITRPPRLGDGTETVAWGPPDTRSHQVRLPWGGGFPGSLHAGGPRRAGYRDPCLARRARKAVQTVSGDPRMDHRQSGHLVRHEVRRSRHSGQTWCLWQDGLARLARHEPVIGHHTDPSVWHHGRRVGSVTGLATASTAAAGSRAHGRARQVGRRRPG